MKTLLNAGCLKKNALNMLKSRNLGNTSWLCSTLSVIIIYIYEFCH